LFLFNSYWNSQQIQWVVWICLKKKQREEINVDIFGKSEIVNLIIIEEW
jgi:hypothetical protein